MGYGKFVQELNKGIEGKIAAYSRRDNEEGCLIYLHDLDQRIFVGADLIEPRRGAVIHALRTKIRDGMKGESVLVLKQVGNDLVFEEDAETSHRIPGPYPTLKSVR